MQTPIHVLMQVDENQVRHQIDGQAFGAFLKARGVSTIHLNDSARNSVIFQLQAMHMMSKLF